MSMLKYQHTFSSFRVSQCPCFFGYTLLEDVLDMFPIGTEVTDYWNFICLHPFIEL